MPQSPPMRRLGSWNRSAAESAAIFLPLFGTPKAKNFTGSMEVVAQRVDRVLLGRNVAILAKQPGDIVRTYAVNGKPPAKGDIFRNPDLAHTYRLLSEQGRDAFYKGEIAEKIDAFFRANGGYLRKEDFVAHQSEWVEPISANYRGYEVYETAAEHSGV
jgi:gamma-glutamyltranspeptidase